MIRASQRRSIPTQLRRRTPHHDGTGHADATHQMDHAAHDDHAGHDKHAGHDPEAFRRKFWLSLILTIPVVLYSEMVQEWLRFSMPEFPGSDLIAPVLGTVIFFYGGWVFLKGGWDELRAPGSPGMMLLISLAIVVAFVASLATTFGWLDLEFWWELALLVTIMLLGHWLEMRAIGQAQGALSALAALLPDEAERIGADGAIETVAGGLPPQPGIPSWSGRAHGSRPMARSSTARPGSTSR